jgi:aspartate oxidase
LIEILEHTEVAALRHDGQSVTGVIALGESGVREIPAPDVVLATGGVGQLYAVTTNPLVATGDGWALAWQVGAELRDLEFLQFHPTALKLPGVNPAPLITEAVRGAGGLLLDRDGHRFAFDAIRAVNWRLGMLWPAPSRRPMLRAVPGSTRGRFRISLTGSPGSPASWPLTESIRRRS